MAPTAILGLAPSARAVPSGSWAASLRSERFWAWAGPLAATAFGGVVRFRHLGTPHALVFDEVYYVKEAASYLQYGYEIAPLSVEPGAPDPFVAGGSVWGTTGEFVVHPPVGKWMIAAGEWLAGGPADPAGWRLASAVCGTLALLMVGRIAFRLFGSALLATTASLLLAVDGLEFVHSRTGILDIFVMFWALAAFGCLLLDRDAARRRLAATVPTTGRHLDRHAPPGTGIRAAGTAPPWGPWLGIRWWRLAAIVCLTLCTGVKWSGLYVAAAFLTLSVCWDAGARRAAGVRHWMLAGLGADGAQALASTAVLLPAGYLATWWGWLAGDGGWGRQWGSRHPAEPGWGWVPDAVRSLWHYHAEMWHFHLTLHTPHPYMSSPWSWPVLGRPVAFFYRKQTQGHGGCTVRSCSEAIHALGNPVVWWGGTIAVAVLVVRWLLARDWRAGAALSGWIGGYLPWFLYTDRTIFQFYAVAFTPWVVLGITYCLGLLLGPRNARRERRRRAGLAAGSYVLAAVAAFWFFYPVLAAQVVPHTAWALRMWLPSWI